MSSTFAVLRVSISIQTPIILKIVLSTTPRLPLIGDVVVLCLALDYVLGCGWVVWCCSRILIRPPNSGWIRIYLLNQMLLIMYACLQWHLRKPERIHTAAVLCFYPVLSRPRVVWPFSGKPGLGAHSRSPALAGVSCRRTEMKLCVLLL